MRMTNKIMQSNSLYNINQTKILEDKYNTELTSQSKITRPSDDPVIAIRALRLRSNVSTVSQYYEKNSPDAEQWLDVTAESLNTITDVITDLYHQVQTGVNKDYTSSDMEVLLTQIEAYTNEMYATGNQDYAGRYIFTGYRTDTPLTMDEDDEDRDFTITEDIKSAQLDTFSYTDYSIFSNTADAEKADELDITNATLSRIRLSYNELTEDSPTITVTAPDTAKTVLLSVKPDDFTACAEADDALGVDYASFSSAEEAYKAMTKVENGAASQPKIAYIASTGEILYSSKLKLPEGASDAQSLSDIIENGGSISVTYDKDSWAVNTLNPEHYFNCIEHTTDGRDINYNSDGDVDTVISYDVGYNQVIQVNTNACEVFDPAISRDYDDLKSLVEQYAEIEELRSQYSSQLNSMETSDGNYSMVKQQYEAADKAYTYIRDAVSTRFGDQISRYQSYLDATNVAITKNGTRSTRLELIDTRLSTQASTFKELQEENEGIDMTEVAVKLTSAETTYDAALAATSKIMKNSLIDYI